MTDPQAPLSDDELLSAYLDGALGGDELSRAERLLAEQPGSRQLLEELRALGNGLRELPRSQLGDAFPERVMRKAERQLLSESAPPTVLPADSLEGRLRNKRPWIYAAVTLAAGLLVAVFSWPHQTAKTSMKLASAHADHTGENETLERYASAHAHDSSARKLGEPDRLPSVALKADAAAKAGEDDVPLKQALARAGLVQLSDQIVRQVNADEAAVAPAEGEPLAVWLCTVSPDALEQDVLGSVLTRNRVQMLDENRLASSASKPVDAVHAMKAATEWVDVVLVTATPGQLGATLADIRSQSTTFRNLKQIGYHHLPATPSAAAAAQTTTAAIPPPVAGSAQNPGHEPVRATVGTRTKQAKPTSGDQQVEVAGDRTGRAVRLRFGNPSGSTLQAPPSSPSTSPAQGRPAVTRKSQSSRVPKNGDKMSEKRRGAESKGAVKLEQALFILRYADPPGPSTGPPASPAPAKAAQ